MLIKNKKIKGIKLNIDAFCVIVELNLLWNGANKMNFKIDLAPKHQNLLTEINYPVLDKEYSKDDIKNCVSYIAEHCMSLSSKNNILKNELQKFDDLMRILVKNEK